MSFKPTTCPDCFYPPNFSIVELKDKNDCVFYSIKCRDCGDAWEESAGPNFSENFFENTRVFDNIEDFLDSLDED